MTWFAAGAAAVGTLTTIAGGMSQARQGIRNANAVSRAEGEAITKERLNTTIRNSYQAAFGQMQLALQKRQLSQQRADLGAASLMAKGEAEVAAAATGSVGASTDAVALDIQQKVDQAQQTADAAFENAIENYNNDLQLMVLNTELSAQEARPVTYEGPSTGQIVAGGIIGGLTSFASSYASRRMQLGLGSRAPVQRQELRTYDAMSVNLGGLYGRP